MIGDPAGANQVFTDDEIQEALDRHQVVARYVRLRAEPRYGPNGQVEYFDVWADIGPWEDGVTLVDGDYNTLTPATADLNAGHWTFQNSTPPPILATGYYYDTYGAAADLLEQWAARARAFDVDADGASYKRSQTAQQLLALAATYRRQAWPVVAVDIRDDANPIRVV